MHKSMWYTIGLTAAILIGIGDWELRATPFVETTTARVTSGTITRRLLASGTLQAITTVQVGTQDSGIVQVINVDFNSLVHKGDVLARLDPSPYQALVEQAQANVAQALAGVGAAEANVDGFRTAVVDARTQQDRAERLFATVLIPESDRDAARNATAEAVANLASGQSQAVRARAAVEQANAALNQAKANLDLTIIRSPIDGVVLSRAVDVGQTLTASLQTPLMFQIASDFKHLQIQVDIDESDLAGLKAGEPASFQVESYPDQTFKGVVRQVRLQAVTAATTTGAGGANAGAQTAGPAGAVVSYTTIIDIDNPDEQLRPGMTATVLLDGTRRDNVIRIPNNALSFRPPPEALAAAGQTGDAPAAAAPADVTGTGAKPRLVWEYDGRKFTAIAVRTGIADEQWTELLSGSLHADEVLVTNASVRLKRRLTGSR